MPKNIVLCSDGTGNTAIKGRGTNVFKLYEALDLDPGKQIAFYDDGVGTERLRPLAAFGGAFGVGLSRNVRQLYTALARVYEPGDRIFLFGFSRGAFTVRALAGFIAACGIVDRGRRHSDDGLTAAVKEAYSAYRDRYRTWLARLFRGKPSDQPETVKRVRAELAVQHGPRPEREAWQAPIAFMGVWDTVDAVGFPVPFIADAFNTLVYPYKFPNRRLGPTVLRARHALAIDDQRHTFHPLLWDERPGPDDRLTDSVPNPQPGETPTGRIQQVWFPGVHSNVGGGYLKQGMSIVSLVWMMDEARAAGLEFCRSDADLYGERQNATDQLYNSRAGIGFYYRFMPRDIDRLCRENGIVPVLHSSAVTRILTAPDGYAPGNIPRDARVAGPAEAAPTKLVEAMRSALGSELSLLPRVRGCIGVRRAAQTAVAFLTLGLVGLALRGGSGAEWSFADLLSSAGIASAIGTFVLGSISAMKWPVVALLVVGVLAYIADWLAAARMRRVYSEFWYAVRGKRRSGG
jgi:uncharacterized protein (DUF2235 family)